MRRNGSGGDGRRPPRPGGVATAVELTRESGLEVGAGGFTDVKLTSFEAVVRALNDADVPFIVVGGLAVNAHGYGRFTWDVDLVVRLRPDAIRDAFRALAGLGYHPRVPITAEGFSDPGQRARWITEKGMAVLNFHSDSHRETPVDVFVSEPFDFDEEYAQALVEEVGAGVAVRILRLPALLKLKRQTGRQQDLADVAELVLLHGDSAGA